MKARDFKAIVERAREEFRFRKIIFLIADQIELVNQRVFSRGRERRLVSRVETMASELERTIRTACAGEELKQGRIKTCRWVDILDSGYWSTYFEIRRLFLENPIFKGDVEYAIREYAQRRKKSFSPAETLYLCSYVLQEIPTLLYGINVNGKHYNSMVYPAPRNASIDRICAKLVAEGYSMTVFDPPFCQVVRYEIPLQ